MTAGSLAAPPPGFRAAGFPFYGGTSLTLFGMVVTRTYESGAVVWAPTYDPEDMCKPTGTYLPCETVPAGVAALSQMHPVPAVSSWALARVFGCHDRVLVLPHPMLLSLSDPRNREVAYAEKLTTILTQPECGGVLYLPAPGVVAQLVPGDAVSPTLSRGLQYYKTTPYTFASHLRKSSDFRRFNVVFGQSDLSGSSHAAFYVKVDHKAAARRAKGDATRARNLTTKAAAEERMAAEREVVKTRERQVAEAWKRLCTAAEALWAEVPCLRGFAFATRQEPESYSHPAVQFLQTVKLHERLVGKRQWRDSPAVVDAMGLLRDAWPLVSGPDDWEFKMGRHDLPPVRAAVAWLTTEIDSLTRRQKWAAGRARTKKVESTPVPSSA